MLDANLPAEEFTMQTFKDLRDHMPFLHPYAVLNMTLEPMIVKGEISTEEYLRWSSMLVRKAGRSLFTRN